jgi:hypothetical protein
MLHSREERIKDDWNIKEKLVAGERVKIQVRVARL